MLYRTSIAPFYSLRRDIDRLFEDVMGRDAAQGGWTPAVDVREEENALVLELELPGVNPEHVEVTAENGVLTIRGEKRSERKEGDEQRRWFMVERTHGAFHRAFQLPKGVDESQIEAAFEHGLLTVRVPHSALPQPRRIQVRNGGQREDRQVSGGNDRQVTSGNGQSRERTSARQGSAKGTTGEESR